MGSLALRQRRGSHYALTMAYGYAVCVRSLLINYYGKGGANDYLDQRARGASPNKD